MAKINNKNKTSPQATHTLNQRGSNNHNKLIAAAALDSLEHSEVIQKHTYGACACGNSVIIDENNHMKRQYSCKKRFCIACAQKYAFKRDLGLYPAVNDICKAKKDDPKHNSGLWFVTLTLPTCEWQDLPARLGEVQYSFVNIYKQMKKAHKKSYVNGIRKLEVNPNLKAGISPRDAIDHKDYMYHAHLHLLVQGKGNAYEFRRRWLARHPEANFGGQDVRPFDHEKGTLIELIKYISKPAAAGESKKLKSWQAVSAQPEHEDYIKESTWTSHARRSALVYIYDCLIGRRTIFTYGSIKKAAKCDVFIDKDENGRPKIFETISNEFYDTLNNLKEEAKEIKSKPQNKATEYRLKQIERQSKRINDYVNCAKTEATRDLRNTLWKYFNGHYINEDTGEQLCSEEEVEAADLSDDKKTYRLTKEEVSKNLLNTKKRKKKKAGDLKYTLEDTKNLPNERKSPKRKRTTASLVREKRIALKQRQKEAEKWQILANLEGEQQSSVEPADWVSLQDRLQEEVDHRKLFPFDPVGSPEEKERYRMWLFKREKAFIETGNAGPLKENDPKMFEKLLRRGLERQRQFWDDPEKFMRFMHSVLPLFIPRPNTEDEGWVDPPPRPVDS